MRFREIGRLEHNEVTGGHIRHDFRVIQLGQAPTICVDVRKRDFPGGWVSDTGQRRRNCLNGDKVIVRALGTPIADEGMVDEQNDDRIHADIFEA